LFWVWPFLLLQISTLHSFEDPQLGGIRHTYFFPSVIIPSDCLGFVKRKRYPFTSYDLIEDFNAQAGVFFFSFSFFFIGGRIVDGFAFSWLGRKEGRKEGKGGWMDTISEFFSWIELNWHHSLFCVYSQRCGGNGPDLLIGFWPEG